MTRTFLDDLFEGLQDTFETIEQQLARVRRERAQASSAPTPVAADESKLINALGKCAPEYRAALTRLVEQTATHVTQSNNQALTDAFVPAAIYTKKDELARTVLDAVVKPTLAQREIRGLLHYQVDNFRVSAAVFEQLDGHYTTIHARYAHVGALHQQGKIDPQQYGDILRGLQTRVAPAAEMLGVTHFNREEYGSAALYFSTALEQDLSARRMLNLMTARHHQQELREQVQRQDIPRLFQEFRYEGSITDVERELNRESLSFPYLKLNNMFELVGKVYAQK